MNKPLFNHKLIESKRQSLNLSIEDFCSKCKINIKEYYQFLHNDLDINLVTIARIARFVKIKLYEIFL